MNRFSRESGFLKRLSETHTIRRYHIENSAEEIERFAQAQQKAHNRVKQLFESAAAGEEYELAAELSAQLEVLSDENVTEAVCDEISDEMINAEVALAQVCDRFSETADNSGGAMHMASELIIRILLGLEV